MKSSGIFLKDGTKVHDVGCKSVGFEVPRNPKLKTQRGFGKGLGVRVDLPATP